MTQYKYTFGKYKYKSMGQQPANGRGSTGSRTQSHKSRRYKYLNHKYRKKYKYKTLGSRRQIEEAPLDGESSHRQIGDSPTSLDLQNFHHHQIHQSLFIVINILVVISFENIINMDQIVMSLLPSKKGELLVAIILMVTIDKR